MEERREEIGLGEGRVGGMGEKEGGGRKREGGREGRKRRRQLQSIKSNTIMNAHTTIYIPVCVYNIYGRLLN